jgi:hypothetical protein
MRWAPPRKAGHPKSWVHDVLVFHDLFDDQGQMLGWVRQDTRYEHGCTITINEHLFEPDFDNAPMPLELAKKTLLAHFVLKKLED